MFWLRVAHERSRWLSNDVELLASPSSPRTGEQLENSTERLATVAGLEVEKDMLAIVKSHEDSYPRLVQEHFCKLCSAAHALVDCGVVLRVVFLQDCGQSRGRLRMRPWR